LHGGTGLMTVTTMTFRCCPSRIPTSAFGQRDVGATGRIPKRSYTTAAPSVASVMSFNSDGHIMSLGIASQWFICSPPNLLYIHIKVD
jgi:hypothetical protein